MEVLPPEEKSRLDVQRQETISAIRLLHEHFLVSPAIRPLSQPKILRDDLEASFPHRFGVAVIFACRSFEYALSPTGTLRAFSLLFLRWFIALLMIVVAACVPMIIAAQFIDQVAGLLESAMKHLFWAVVWVAAAIGILAAICAGLAVASK